MKKTFSATGTIWSIRIDLKNNSSQKIKILNLILESLSLCQKKVADFEKKYSRFIPNSQLCLLNKTKTLANPDAEFLDVLQKVEFLRKVSQNNFNPWMGKQKSQLGYGPKTLETEKENPGKGDLKLNSNSSKIILENEVLKIPKNYNLDLGGFAKGYLADILEKIILTKFENQKEIDLGKDLENIELIINAGGDLKVFNNQDKISLQTKFENQELFIGKIDLKNGSIASSSPGIRNWVDSKNQKQHHLISSKNQKPVATYKAVFVIASEGYLADSLATCLITSEQKFGFELAQKLNLKCLFLTHENKVLTSEGFPKISSIN